MPRKSCDVKNCDQLIKPLHPFPNEKLNPARFKTWLEACGDPLLYKLDARKLHTHYFVCHRHFEEKFISKTNRLIKIAIPTLHLPISTFTGQSEKDVRLNTTSAKTDSLRPAIVREPLVKDSNTAARSKKNVGLDIVSKENVSFKSDSLRHAIIPKSVVQDSSTPEKSGKNVLDITSKKNASFKRKSLRHAIKPKSLAQDPNAAGKPKKNIGFDIACEKNVPYNVDTLEVAAVPDSLEEDLFDFSYLTLQPDGERNNPSQTESTSEDTSPHKSIEDPISEELPPELLDSQINVSNCTEITIEDNSDPITEELPPELLDPEINGSSCAEITIQNNTEVDSLKLSNTCNEPCMSPPKKNIIKVFGNNRELKKPSVIESLLGKARLSKKGNVYILPIKENIDAPKLSNRKIEKIVRENTSGLNRKQLLKIIRAARRPTKTPERKKICTCSIHRCQQNHLHETLVRSSISSRLDGKFFSDVSDKELINPSSLKTAFSISTILTNVNDKSQVEQLCQLVIESIFRLKNVNIEKSMGMLTVYFAESPGQKPSNETQGSMPTDISSTVNVNYSENAKEEHMTVRQNNFLNPSCNDETMEVNDEGENLISKNNNSNSKSVELSANSEINQFPSETERNNTALSEKTHFKINLGAFHDHSYLALKSKILFEKPEYLVNLININTYWAFKRKSSIITPPPKVKHVPVKFQRQFSKLNNKIKRLQDIVIKKGNKIKLLDGKLKSLKTTVKEKMGVKSLKCPKEVNVNQVAAVRDESALKKSSSTLEKRSKGKCSKDFDMFPFIDEYRDSLDDLNPDLLLQDNIYDRFDDFFESVNLDF